MFTTSYLLIFYSNAKKLFQWDETRQCIFIWVPNDVFSSKYMHAYINISNYTYELTFIVQMGDIKLKDDTPIPERCQGIWIYSSFMYRSYFHHRHPYSITKQTMIIFRCIYHIIDIMSCQDKIYTNITNETIGADFPINLTACVLWEDRLMRLLPIWHVW